MEAILNNRITPAYAGKSLTIAGNSENDKDHPRVCGEKKSEYSMVIGILGSPPRMRGKGKYAPGEACSVWITPAYAGKSSHDGNAGGLFKDHPRVCGEKAEGVVNVTNVQGSPPRMRGKD